ncbi:hypothetical protein OPV22_023792 [Ensete ventricosum]|uniref:Secreted protein n=1 Tax=Ensete ventricosum TaxID=4639 RepID=A0AAV8PD91_ENSVE|nr:hypothetical protein OPV22_023792 [Ensete ventricosum]
MPPGLLVSLLSATFRQRMAVCNSSDLFEKCSNVDAISGTINITTAISWPCHSYTSNSASQFTAGDTTQTPFNTTTCCITVNSATRSNRYTAAKHSAVISNYRASANCCDAAA